MTIYAPLERPTRLYIKQCSHCGLKYFGKSVREDIEEYNGSGVRWNKHLKKHNIIPVTLWVSDWYYDTTITKFAKKFSNINKIVESTEWANLVEENGLQGGDTSNTENFKLGLEKQKKTRADPDWMATKGKEHSRKLSETQNDPDWKATVGIKKREKQSIKISKTENDPLWKETIGKEKQRKHKATLNDPEWKNTVGLRKSRKLSATYSDEEWNNTVGKEKSRKISEKASKRFNDPEWRARNYKTCPHCNKCVSPAVYGRLHGERCKLKSP